MTYHSLYGVVPPSRRRVRKLRLQVASLEAYLDDLREELSVTECDLGIAMDENIGGTLTPWAPGAAEVNNRTLKNLPSPYFLESPRGRQGGKRASEDDRSRSPGHGRKRNRGNQRSGSSDQGKQALTEDVRRESGSISNNGLLSPRQSVKPRIDSPYNQSWPLDLSEYKRYGRQMILPEISTAGQLNLKKSRVLIVGLGGLGCPAAIYLAGAGVGVLGLMDGDILELSNLHRQVLYSESGIGSQKAILAAQRLRELNPAVKYNIICDHLLPGHALRTVEDNYDLILDCTDHPSSRYLASDLAVVAGIPLVSASALKTDGQLLVLNNPPCSQRGMTEGSGFCYRCVFPRPPPPETLQSCGEGGILGPVVGIMGTLMAIEAIKLLTQEKPSKLEDSSKTMLLYSAYSETPFRTIRLPGKRPDCPTCSWPPKIDRHALEEETFDYVKFCGTREPEDSEQHNRISAAAWADYVNKFGGGNEPKVIDVRNATEFDICHLPNSINYPLSEIRARPSILLDYMSTCEADEDNPDFVDGRPRYDHPMVFVCRYGNDSREAVEAAIHYHDEETDLRHITMLDLKGGLKAWKDEVDLDFPEY